VPEITTQRSDTPSWRIVVEGEVIDPPDGSQLYEVICEAVHCRAKSVEVDLSGVDLFGSEGLNALVHAHQDAKRLGCLISVSAVSPLVRRVFEVTRLTELFGLEQG
jgi:anti-anti-sigma factor